jgi:hypothetical protein
MFVQYVKKHSHEEQICKTIIGLILAKSLMCVVCVKGRLL